MFIIILFTYNVLASDKCTDIRVSFGSKFIVKVAENGTHKIIKDDEKILNDDQAIFKICSKQKKTKKTKN